MVMTVETSPTEMEAMCRRKNAANSAIYCSIAIRYKRLRLLHFYADGFVPFRFVGEAFAGVIAVFEAERAFRPVFQINREFCACEVEIVRTCRTGLPELRNETRFLEKYGRNACYFMRKAESLSPCVPFVRKRRIPFSFGQNDFAGARALFKHGSDDHIPADEKFVFEARVGNVRRAFPEVEQGTHHGRPGAFMFQKNIVEVGEHPVAELNPSADHGQRPRPELPGFLVLHVLCTVNPEEREKARGFHPALHQFRAAVISEASHVRAHHGNAGKRKPEGHRDAGAQVAPRAEVIPEPQGRDFARARGPAPRKQKGTRRGSAFEEPCARCLRHACRILIVICSVRKFPVSEEHVFLRHGSRGRIVHIEPVAGESFVCKAAYKGRPPAFRLREAEIREERRSGPDESAVIVAVRNLAEHVRAPHPRTSSAMW